MNPSNDRMGQVLPGYVVIELIGAEEYQGPEGFWVRGLYQLIPSPKASDLLAMKNSANEPLFRMHP